MYSVNIIPLLQLDIKAESELKEENDEDYAMNSESYLEVKLFILNHFKGFEKPLTLVSSGIFSYR